MSKIEIIVNGKNIQIEQNSTIEQLLIERNVTGKMFVVEKNKKIIQKQDYDKEFLKNGDSIEIAGFFGGG